MNWDLSKFLIRFGGFLPRQRITGFLEWSLIRDVLQKYAINCVLDVGANRGRYARSLRRIGYRGLICSFEPVPEEYEHLCTAMQSDPNWLGFEIALGSEDTNQIFHIAVESTAMSSFLRHKDNSAIMRDITVEVRQLDSVLTQILSSIPEPRIFLKLDTQGYDLEVVKGAGNSLNQILCLQSEISVDPIYDKMPHYLTALEAYQHLGFHLSGLFEVDRRQVQETIVEMNCLMVRTENVS